MKKDTALLKEKKHLAFSDLEISRLGALVNVLKDTSHYHSSKFADTDVAVLLRLLKTWPVTMIFPGRSARLLKVFYLVHNFGCLSFRLQHVFTQYITFSVFEYASSHETKFPIE